MSVTIEVETVEIVVQDETVLNPIVVEVGDPYIPGPGSLGSTTFPHTQSSPALEWLIPLTGSGQPTSVLVKNDSGEVIMARILEASSSQVVIRHRIPTSGSAVVSKGA